MAKRWMSSLFIAVLAIIVSEQTASAQTVGTDICACQPSVYKLKLDFSLVCTDTTVAGPGINNTACIVTSRDQNENVTNPFPVTVSEVQVLELGRNLKVVGNSVFSGTFFDGDEISYTSVTVEEPETINADTIPRGFQIFITGVNSDEEPLVNQLVITYTNDCGIFPLLEIGDLIGWVNFVSGSTWLYVFCLKCDVNHHCSYQLLIVYNSDGPGQTSRRILSHCWTRHSGPCFFSHRVTRCRSNRKRDRSTGSTGRTRSTRQSSFLPSIRVVY